MLYNSTYKTGRLELQFSASKIKWYQQSGCLMMITSQKTLINTKNDWMLAHSTDHSKVPQHQGVQQYLQDKAKFRGILVYPIFLRQSRSSLSEKEGLLMHQLQQNPESRKHGHSKPTTVDIETDYRGSNLFTSVNPLQITKRCLSGGMSTRPQ